MIKVSVMYPNNEGSHFDIDYYCNIHIPLVQDKIGSALKGVAVDHGLGGAEPGSSATYVAIGHLIFESEESFQTAFGPEADTIIGDIPNFTDTQPTIQISEIKI